MMMFMFRHKETDVRVVVCGSTLNNCWASLAQYNDDEMLNVMEEWEILAKSYDIENDDGFPEILEL